MSLKTAMGVTTDAKPDSNPREDKPSPHATPMQVSGAGEGKKKPRIERWSSFGNDAWGPDVDRVVNHRNHALKTAALAIQGLTLLGQTGEAMKLVEQMDKAAASCKGKKKGKKKAKMLKCSGIAEDAMSSADAAAKPYHDSSVMPLAAAGMAGAAPAIGALGGLFAGADRGNTPEGIGRGLISGAGTGAGIAGGGYLGNELAGKFGGGPAAKMLAALAGMLVGGVGGYKGTQAVMGPPESRRKKTASEELMEKDAINSKAIADAINAFISRSGSGLSKMLADPHASIDSGMSKLLSMGKNFAAKRGPILAEAVPEAPIMAEAVPAAELAGRAMKDPGYGKAYEALKGLAGKSGLPRMSSQNAVGAMPPLDKVKQLILSLKTGKPTA